MAADHPEYGELMQQLCVAAGMIMEDTSAEAVRLLPVTSGKRQSHVKRICRAGADAAALIVAAEVLGRRFASQREN